MDGCTVTTTELNDAAAAAEGRKEGRQAQEKRLKEKREEKRREEKRKPPFPRMEGGWMDMKRERRCWMAGWLDGYPSSANHPSMQTIQTNRREKEKEKEMKDWLKRKERKKALQLQFGS